MGLNRSMRDEPKRRMATLTEIMRDILPNFISPVPARETVRDWLDNARVPRFKSNPAAKRGGGHCYYSLAGVEKVLAQKTMPK